MLSILVYVLVAVLLSYLMFDTYIRAERQIAFNKINTLYDQMELYVVRNNVVLNRDTVNYLKGFKEFKVNNELADIQILISILMTKKHSDLERMILEHDRVVAKMPKELVDIGGKINSEVMRSIRLSMFKTDFLLLLIPMMVKAIFRSAINFSFSYVQNFAINLTEFFNRSDEVPYINSSFGNYNLA